MSTSQGRSSAGPPYSPTIATIGGQPTVSTDVPILAVLIAFYLGSAIGNMSILQLNKRKGHKFAISGVLFGFSLARIITCSLRISSAAKPHDIPIFIAALIYVNIGIILLYIVNLILVQRILRARHPSLGWHGILRIIFRLVYICIFIALALLIIFIVLSFYTTNHHMKQVCRDVQLAAITYYLVVAALPFLFLAIAFLWKPSPKAEHFGHGSMRTKGLILVYSTCLCTLGAGYKAGANWMPPRPIGDPAWYEKKAPFYVFYFALEICIIYFFMVVRVDRRFYVADGSSRRKSFSALGVEQLEQQQTGSEEHLQVSQRVENEPHRSSLPDITGGDIDEEKEGELVFDIKITVYNDSYLLRRMKHSVRPFDDVTNVHR